MAEEITEWADPSTGDIHSCPDEYVAYLRAHLRHGKDNAQTGSEILGSMLNRGCRPGEEREWQSKLRHIRKASYELRKEGIAVISFRSAKKGGYYIAQDREEAMEFVKTQYKLAESMMRAAEKLAERYGVSIADLSAAAAFQSFVDSTEGK